MATAGVWMLVGVAALMIATGLPAWMMLIAIALAFSSAGVAVGAVPLPLLTSIPSRLLGLLENDLLQALPLYVLMGAMFNRLPLAEVLVRTASRALRWTGAGAPLAGLGLGVLLAPMNGSVGASAATLSRTILPRLAAAGITAERSAALVCVSSTLGVVVPPSLVLILLGDAMLRAHTEAVNLTGHAVRIVNTQDVFRGALLPAALLLLFCALVAWWQDRGVGIRALASVPPPSTSGEWITAVVATLCVAGLLAAVTLGYLYAVEAAATGGVALACYGIATRALTRSVLGAILRDTMAITGALFALLVGATIFTLVVRAFGTDRWVAALLSGMGGDGRVALGAVLLLLGLCSFVLDAFEMIFVVIPIVMPPLLVRVPDAAWVAVLTLLILQASFLVPPIGYAVLMVRNQLERPIPTAGLVRALWPFLAVSLVVLSLVLAFPAFVWRGPTFEPAAGESGRPLSDDEAGALFRRQLEENDADPLPNDGKKQ